MDGREAAEVAAVGSMMSRRLIVAPPQISQGNVEEAAMLEAQGEDVTPPGLKAISLNLLALCTRSVPIDEALELPHKHLRVKEVIWIGLSE